MLKPVCLRHKQLKVPIIQGGNGCRYFLGQPSWPCHERRRNGGHQSRRIPVMPIRIFIRIQLVVIEKPWPLRGIRHAKSAKKDS